jgi:hypothetical protein
VVHAFNQKGLAALDPQWAGGRPRLISDDAIKIIVATATARPAWARRSKPDRLPATYHRTHGIRYFHGCYSLADDQLWGVTRRRKGGDHTRLAAAVAARPVSIRLADAVIGAIVEQRTDPAEHDRDTLLLITAAPRSAMHTLAPPRRSGIPSPTRSPSASAIAAGRPPSAVGERGRRRSRRSRTMAAACCRVSRRQRNRRAVRIAALAAPDRARTTDPSARRSRKTTTATIEKPAQAACPHGSSTS